MIAFLTPLARAADGLIDWSSSLDDAYMRSQVNNRPMLVFIGTERSDVSRQLWSALQQPPCAAILRQQWNCARLSSDAASPALRSMAVAGVPAIRLLAADGRVIASHDGSLSAEEFAAWLERQKHSATDWAVGSADIASLLGSLGDSNVAVRESASRQLRDQPDAAEKVVQLLSGGSLPQRLSAVDLLEQWGAPTAGIDPWQPATISPQTMLDLSKWAKSRAINPSPTTAPSVADELDALLLAPTEIQARAVRQRLVKFGPAILPQVYQRLTKTTHEPGRHRLVALRYRLTATDQLAGDWPGGFDRLASGDAEIRRSAVADLAAHARPADHRLLSEMFSDADPFVRAQSLKLLRSLGGAETNKELMALLGDPEPNVRAAVLDTFAGSPDASIVGNLMRYTAGEKDTDLVVHVVHVLEATPGAEAFDALGLMLKHPQWRVRGEAAESFRAKLLQSGEGLSDEQKNAATAALVKLLDDPDGYVATRAAQTLIKAEFEKAVKPLMARIDSRPDLAKDVLKALGGGILGRSYLPDVRRLMASMQPSVRSAAVIALASIAPESAGDEMGRAFHDPDELVREAALHGAQLTLAALVPTTQPSQASDQSLFNNSNSNSNLPWPQGIAAFRAGRGRPKWLNDMEPDLEKALSADATRVPAAAILCALEKDELAMPVLLHVKRGEVPDAAGALQWLPWESRLRLYHALLALVGVDKGTVVIEAFAAVPDPHLADELWSLLGPAAKPGDFETVYDSLRKVFLGNNYYNAGNLPVAQKLMLEKLLLQRVHDGYDLQRSAALAMLLDLSPELAARAAQRMRKDPTTTEWGRLDALQVQLVSQASDVAEPIAVEALADPPLRKAAIPYLAAGTSQIRELRGSVYLSFSTTYTDDDSNIKLPAGLNNDVSKAALRQAMAGGDSEVAGFAAYLLALTGEHGAYDILLANWRANDKNDTWSQLVYRVIARNNDDSQVPVLEEIYKGCIGQFDKIEMYNTIRRMTGPNAAKLIKTMKKAVE